MGTNVGRISCCCLLPFRCFFKVNFIIMGILEDFFNGLIRLLFHLMKFALKLLECKNKAPKKKVMYVCI